MLVTHSAPGKTRRVLCFILALLFCSLVYGKSIPVEQRSEVRQSLNQVAEDIVAAMVEKDPALQQALDDSTGYMAGVLSTGTMVVIGGGMGAGLIYDKLDNSRTYVNVKRLDLGAGLGAGRYRYLVIFQDHASLLKFRSGTWRRTMGAESVAGEHGKTASGGSGKGFTTHVLSESGASVAITLRLAKISVNYDLTDTGVSSFSIPMTGFDEAGQQGDDAPRIWDHKLPFLAQKVLDEGYDLPLPYGVGLIYAYVDQDQLINNLQVGLNGSEIIPFEFVSFENVVSKSDSLQLRYDTWLFPFMNVYAMVGKTKGDAPLDVLLDGNGMLEHLDVSCGGIINNPLCNLLGGKTITLPIEATFSGKTYSVGMVLAGGWKSYFVTLPFNWTYADMDTTDSDGEIVTVSPRVGKLINLGNKGNLALFVGGNYIKSDLTVVGQVGLEDLLTIDYVIDQENKDKWNAVIGGNWDINRNWSIAMEYNGFTGSREAYIASLTWRF